MSRAEQVAAVQDLVSKLKVQLGMVSGYDSTSLKAAVTIFEDVFEILDPMIALALNEMVEQDEQDTLWSLAAAEAAAWTEVILNLGGGKPLPALALMGRGTFPLVISASFLYN